jgi:hypothetical protein
VRRVAAVRVAIASAAALALLGAATVQLAPAAGASGVAGSGTIGPGGLTVTLQVRRAGGPPVPANDPHAPRPFTVITAPSHNPGLSGICPVPGVPVPPPWGWWWNVFTIDNATGALVSVTFVCVPLAAGQPPPGTPPQVARPPTIGEIWAHVPLPQPTLGLSPVSGGVTGLATWIWGVSATQAAIDATINGYTVTGTAHVIGWSFATGDGTVVARVTGGTATAPALRHVYERTGTYPLSVTTLWSANVTISGPGFPARATPIGQALLSGEHDYPVVQVRSVLVS